MGKQNSRGTRTAHLQHQTHLLHRPSFLNRSKTPAKISAAAATTTCPADEEDTSSLPSQQNHLRDRPNQVPWAEVETVINRLWRKHWLRLHNILHYWRHQTSYEQFVRYVSTQWPFVSCIHLEKLCQENIREKVVLESENSAAAACSIMALSPLRKFLTSLSLKTSYTQFQNKVCRQYA